MFRWIKNVWLYFRNSIEGDDGKFSYRRGTAFLAMYLVFKMVSDGVVNEYQVNVIYALLGFFVLLCAIVTFDQLERFKNGKSKED